MKISIGSGFNKRLGYRQWIDYPMAAIPVNTSLGQVIGLEVVPSSDGSGNYVWVVRLDDATIDIGTVDVAQIYNITAPVLSNGQMIGFQADINGNLKVNIAASEEGVSIGSINQGEPGNIPWPVAVESLPSLPAGGNTIGVVNQGVAGSSAWKVDPSDVTSPVTLVTELPGGTNTIGTVNQGTAGSSAWKVDASGVTLEVALTTGLPEGSNTIGGTLPAPSASSAFAIAPGSSSDLEAAHVLKNSPGNLYSLYVMTTSVAGFLMTFNATSIPADGAVNPVECIQIPANSAAAISFDGAPPDHYSAGIVTVFSSTGPFTKTGSATAYFKWRVS